MVLTQAIIKKYRTQCTVLHIDDKQLNGGDFSLCTGNFDPNILHPHCQKFQATLKLI
mgnify:CR=1 FL=1